MTMTTRMEDMSLWTKKIIILTVDQCPFRASAKGMQVPISKLDFSIKQVDKTAQLTINFLVNQQHQRALEKAQRELDRERTKLEQQEKKLIMDIKKSAKNGQIGAAKIQVRRTVFF